MPKTRKTKVALIYDFDGTLSPSNMQEYSFIPSLKMKPKEFWDEAMQLAKEHNADNVLTYMYLMLKKANEHDVQVTKEAFREQGKKIPFFEGVEEWFSRINNFGKNKEINVEHYIISSGNKEILEGTKIVKKFKKIFGCSFLYDQHDVAISPGLAINYTTKTQFLFRINKGYFDIWDNSKINNFIPKGKRRIPFKNMIFIGDGSTDIPCMKLVKEQGGHSIAVYKPRSKKEKAEKLINENRVNFVAPANYSEGSRLENIIKTILRKISVDNEINKMSKTN